MMKYIHVSLELLRLENKRIYTYTNSSLIIICKKQQQKQIALNQIYNSVIFFRI